MGDTPELVEAFRTPAPIRLANLILQFARLPTWRPSIWSPRNVALGMLITSRARGGFGMTFGSVSLDLLVRHHPPPARVDEHGFGH